MPAYQLSLSFLSIFHRFFRIPQDFGNISHNDHAFILQLSGQEVILVIDGDKMCIRDRSKDASPVS